MASSHGDRKSAQGILAHFKQRYFGIFLFFIPQSLTYYRNHTLHRAHQYPDANSVDQISPQPKALDVYSLPAPLTK